jgi:hypothetical protein
LRRASDGPRQAGQCIADEHRWARVASDAANGDRRVRFMLIAAAFLNFQKFSAQKLHISFALLLQIEK